MEVEQRKKILHKYLENPEPSHRKIAKDLNSAPSSVCYVIQWYRATLSVDRKMVDHLWIHQEGTHQKLGTTVYAIREVMKTKGYKAYKVVKVPNRNEKQSATVKTRIRKLYEELLLKNNCCILMDDETYVYADTAQIKRKDHYYAKTRLDVPDKNKFK